MLKWKNKESLKKFLLENKLCYKAMSSEVINTQQKM